MNLKDRIEHGMIFYEHGHTSKEDKALEIALDKERRHCKGVLFDYNHTHPDESAKRLGILKDLLGSCGDHVYIEDGVHMSYGSHVYREITERDREYYFRDLKADFPYTLREEC